MRYDFVYENNNGEKINLSKLPYKINIEPLIDYSWSYKTKQRQLGNKIVGFFKDIKDSIATLHVLAATAKERDEAIDYFNNVIEKDIYYGTAGKLWLGDWYTYAFITASKNSKWQYDAGIVKKEITISKEADSWYHITRSANYGEQEESTVYIAEDYIKTYEGRDAESDIKSLTATIAPSQSGTGTPSPENIRPISGWESVETVVCGKNLLNVDSRVNQTTAQVAYSSDDDYVILNGTKYGGGYANLTTLTITLPKGTYYAKAFEISGTASNNISVYPFDGNADVVGNIMSAEKSFMLSEEKTFYFRFAVWNDGTVFSNYKIGIVISTTSGITEYQPYNKNTHTTTTSLGRTVYGGTVDVVKGVLTVTHALVDLGSLTYSRIASSAGVYMFIAYPTGIKTAVAGEKLLACEIYNAIQTINASIATDAMLPNGSVCQSSGGASVRIRDDNYTDPNEFKSSVNGHMLAIPLATPQTYQLTPQTINTLAGVNNVWVDSGDVTVTFRDDHGDIQTESGSIVTFEKKNALSGSGYDYAYDYMHDAQSQKIIANAGSIPCDFIITIQGYADSPIITIGDNTYAVNVEVPYGANLVIDSTQKTVIITLADGTKINAFGARDPDYYLFERIESGKNAVTWDGSYLWELLMIEERSEPRWLTD